MTTIKCKKCGSSIEIDNNESVVQCKCCGELQHLNVSENNSWLNSSYGKKSVVIVAISVFLLIIFLLVYMVIAPNSKYNEAVRLMDDGEYYAAIVVFEELDGYKDSLAKIDECNNLILESKYDNALRLLNAGNYTDAVSSFDALEGYKNSLEMISECKYREALDMLNDGDWRSARSSFSQLGDYKDSFEKLREADLLGIVGNDDINIFSTVLFGACEQREGIAGKEQIEWDVIDRSGDSVLLLSKYVFLGKKYSDNFEDYTWEDCSLRKWLNSTFIEETFTDAEKERIKTVTVKPDIPTLVLGRIADLELCNSTQDKVFILSGEEMREDYRFCIDWTVTAPKCWLRSSDLNSHAKAETIFKKEIDSYGEYVTDKLGVRPALWIDLSE